MDAYDFAFMLWVLTQLEFIGVVCWVIWRKEHKSWLKD